eukprot:211125-Lingulodinium_polyedra.AAC.1
MEADVAGPIPQTVRRRHPFRLTCNKQLIEGFKEANWNLSTPAGNTMIKLLRKYARLHWSTLPVEETIGYMKNTKERKSRKYRKPEVTMMYAIKAKVLEERCKYLPIRLDRPLKQKQEKLPIKAFRPCPKARSLPFNSIVTKSSATEWHSPSATGLNARHADLITLRECAGRPAGFADMENLWLGVLWNIKHRFVYRKKGTKEQTWFLALDHFDSSAVLGWPCCMVDCPGGQKAFEVPSGEQGPVLHAIANLAEWEACSIKPRSWLWQMQLPASSMQQLTSPGNRAFLTFGPAPVEVIAAREAFWDMGVTHLQKLAAVLNIDIKLEQKVSLCGVLFNMVKKILDISDSDT